MPAQPVYGGLARGTLDALEALSTHRLLDRLIRGRIWIGLVAFALIGIVTMQLVLLQLNSGIGRSLERQALLQRDNSSLAIENSELASGDRVEEQAKRLGMTLVPEEALRFGASHMRTDVGKAAQALRTPVQSEATVSAAAPTSEEATEASSSEAAAAGEGEEGGATSETESGEPSTPAASEESSTAASAPVESASANGGTAAAP